MFRDIIGVLFKYVPPPEDEPSAPSPFRFSEPGSLARALEDVGFTNVREESATLPTRFPGDPRRWWESLVDTAAPMQTWMATMTGAERERAKDEIYAALDQYYDQH
jgi:hypothetical protein